MTNTAQRVIGGGSGGLFSISAVLPPVPLVTDAPEQLLANVTAIELSAAHLALGYLASVIGALAPHDTGALAESFANDPATEEGGISITGVETVEGTQVIGQILSTLPQAVVMDEGRRPGTFVSRSGLDALAEWAQRVLGVDPDEAEHVKWALATAIQQRGLPALHYFDQALDAAQGGFDQIYADAEQQIVEMLQGAFTNLMLSSGAMSTGAVSSEIASRYRNRSPAR